MKITLKDGSVIQFDTAVSAKDVAKSISEGLARVAVCAKINGELVDLSTVIEEDCSLELITLKDKEGLDVYRHTVSHVLAQAVKNIFPTSKLAIGPTVENGFYYDIEFKTPVSKDDLPKIEAEMKKIAKENPMTGFVSAKGLTSNPDYLHFNTKSLLEFGTRYYEEFKRIEDKNKVFTEKGKEDDSIRSEMELL